MTDGDAEDAPVVFVAPADVLDLHTFHPRDAAAVTEAFLDEAAAQGFDAVRIIHGKGIGVLKATVRRVLERHPAVASFALAGLDGGGRGATVVTLKRADPA